MGLHKVGDCTASMGKGVVEYGEPPKDSGPSNFLSAALFESDLAAKLQHICDAALLLGSMSDDSDIHRLIPDPKRYILSRQD